MIYRAPDPIRAAESDEVDAFARALAAEGRRTRVRVVLAIAGGIAAFVATVVVMFANVPQRTPPNPCHEVHVWTREGDGMVHTTRMECPELP